jgi:NDP-sugar pyrophosphorylase family protein
MSRSGVDIAKALVPVAGMTMLERNFRQLVKHGFDRILVATPGGEHPVTDFAHGPLTALADALDVGLEVHPEEHPLGNIGAIQLEAPREDPLLVVYADNLTVLDLSAIRRAHCDAAADLTLAVHEQPFRMPFGEVIIEGDLVTDYIEKPTYRILVCSAISVIAPAVIRSIAPGEAIGISDLARRTITAGGKVLAFRHEAPWIDVNDRGDVLRAETLVAEHAAAFADCTPDAFGPDAA